MASSHRQAKLLWVPHPHAGPLQLDDVRLPLLEPRRCAPSALPWYNSHGRKGYHVPFQRCVVRSQGPNAIWAGPASLAIQMCGAGMWVTWSRPVVLPERAHPLCSPSQHEKGRPGTAPLKRAPGETARFRPSGMWTEAASPLARGRAGRSAPRTFFFLPERPHLRRRLLTRLRSSWGIASAECFRHPRLTTVPHLRLPLAQAPASRTFFIERP